MWVGISFTRSNYKREINKYLANDSDMKYNNLTSNPMRHAACTANNAFTNAKIEIDYSHQLAYRVLTDKLRMCAKLVLYILVYCMNPLKYIVYCMNPLKYKCYAICWNICFHIEIDWAWLQLELMKSLIWCVREQTWLIKKFILKYNKFRHSSHSAPLHDTTPIRINSHLYSKILTLNHI